MELADVYVHADYRGLQRTEFDDIAQRFKKAAFAVTRKQFQRGVEVYLAVDEGSLFSKLKVVGGFVLATYVVVSQYKDFRESAIQAYDDAHAFGTVIIDEFKKLTGVRSSEIIYSRTVPRDLNRLRRIVDAVDNLTTYGTANALHQVTHNIAGLYRSMPDDPALGQLVRMLHGQMPQLPSTLDEIVANDERRQRRATAKAKRKPVGPRGGRPRRWHYEAREQI